MLISINIAVTNVYKPKVSHDFEIITVERCLE